jgi:hypothetical protein
MNYLIFLYIILFLAGCANVQPPSGGPPDETPPEIISSVPESETVNFTDNEIIVEFSEYVEQQSVIRSIVIMPEIKTKYRWAGKKLKIEVLDSLNKELTYSLTFGTEYTDLRKNKPKEPFTIIFSAGSRLDSGMIDGKLYAKKPENYSVFAYNILNNNPDTLDIRHIPPDYSLPLGTEGTFSLKALKDGTYRLMCIQDSRNNKVFDVEQDFLFCASKDLIVLNSKSSFAEFKQPQFFDELPPELLSAKSLSEQIIEVSFNEPLDTNSIKTDAFILSDSLGKENFPIDYVFLKSGEDATIQLISKNKLDTLKTYLITAVITSEYVIKDTSENSINDTIRQAFFRPRPLYTEIEPRLKEFAVKDSSEKVDLNKPFNFAFNTAVNMDSLFVDFINLQDSVEVKFDLNKRTGNLFSIYHGGLDDNTWYRLIIDTRKMTGFNNLPVKDSLLRIDFKTIDNRSFGGLNGKVKFTNVECENPVIRIINDNKKYSEIRKLDSAMNFNFESVPPGDYTFEVFCDENNNGRIDAGYYFPFKYSEKFYIPVNEVNVKSRWTVDDIMIYIGENESNKK